MYFYLNLYKCSQFIVFCHLLYQIAKLLRASILAITITSNSPNAWFVGWTHINRPHAFNNIVDIRWIDNNIERVRIDILTKALTVFRHSRIDFLMFTILLSIVVL